MWANKHNEVVYYEYTQLSDHWAASCLNYTSLPEDPCKIHRIIHNNMTDRGTKEGECVAKENEEKKSIRQVYKSLYNIVLTRSLPSTKFEWKAMWILLSYNLWNRNNVANKISWSCVKNLKGLWNNLYGPVIEGKQANRKSLSL